ARSVDCGHTSPQLSPPCFPRCVGRTRPVPIHPLRSAACIHQHCPLPLRSQSVTDPRSGYNGNVALCTCSSRQNNNLHILISPCIFFPNLRYQFLYTTIGMSSVTFCQIRAAWSTETSTFPPVPAQLTNPEPLSPAS